MKELPCVTMKLVDGKLQVGEQGTHRDAIGEFDRAIRDLFEGKEVHVSLVGGLPDAIRRTLTVALREKKVTA